MSQLDKLVGRELEMYSGENIRIAEVYGYEMGDVSVGIMTGYLMVRCDDGNDYDILDNGKVHPAAESGSRAVGEAGIWAEDLETEDNSTRE